MMRFISLFLSALFIVAFGSQNVHAEARFFTSIPEMPLMEGLHELPDQTVSFDKPEGRITESVALIETGTQTEITNFYMQALPQFGWRSVGASSYVREGEMLEIKFEHFEDQFYVRFLISPQE